MSRSINFYMDNMHTCPGFMFVPQKPWLVFGNEYHKVCCGNTGIMFAMEIVKGKDASQSRQHQESSRVWWSWWEDCWPIALPLKVDLGVSKDNHSWQWILCTEGNHWIRKNWLYALALTKRRRFLPKCIRGGEEIKACFKSLECDFADAWPGKLDNIPFHMYIAWRNQTTWCL